MTKAEIVIQVVGTIAALPIAFKFMAWYMSAWRCLWTQFRRDFLEKEPR